jgi:hypothetical protein
VVSVNLLAAQEAVLYRLVPETGAMVALALLGEREQCWGWDGLSARTARSARCARARPIATPNFAEDRASATTRRSSSGSKAPPIRRSSRCRSSSRIASSVPRRLRRRAHLPGQRDSSGAGVADHAALVLESVQLFDDATKRRHEVDVLAEVVGQISSSLDLGDPPGSSMAPAR